MYLVFLELQAEENNLRKQGVSSKWKIFETT